MNEETRAMHLAAGKAYGRGATCGVKVDYTNETSADKAAAAMTAKNAGTKVLEAYPCYWCCGWHIGRAMTEPEMARTTPPSART
jgi:hypothetical protein